MIIKLDPANELWDITLREGLICTVVPWRETEKGTLTVVSVWEEHSGKPIVIMDIIGWYPNPKNSEKSFQEIHDLGEQINKEDLQFQSGLKKLASWIIKKGYSKKVHVYYDIGRHIGYKKTLFGGIRCEENIPPRATKDYLGRTDAYD